MALGDLTKQLASQAIRNAVNPPAAPPRPDNPGTAMLAQVQAMQKALKEDEELIVLFHAGGETVRVLEFFFPSWQVAVLTGIDKDKSVTRVDLGGRIAATGLQSSRSPRRQPRPCASSS